VASATSGVDRNPLAAINVKQGPSREQIWVQLKCLRWVDAVEKGLEKACEP